MSFAERVLTSIDITRAEARALFGMIASIYGAGSPVISDRRQQILSLKRFGSKIAVHPRNGVIALRDIPFGVGHMVRKLLSECRDATALVEPDREQIAGS